MRFLAASADRERETAQREANALRRGHDAEVARVRAEERAALARDINPDQLRRFILAPADGTGAVRVEVTKPTYQDLTKAQVAKLSGAPVVKHEVIAE